MTTPGQGDDATWAAKLLAERSPVQVQPPVPTPAEVIGGFAADAGTVVTVPAGRTWRGRINLTAAATAAIGAAASVQTATLTIAGAGVTPPAGTLLEVAVPLGATTATAETGAGGSERVDQEVVIIAGSADATVTLAKSAGMTTARASARGELIA